MIRLPEQYDDVLTSKRNCPGYRNGAACSLWPDQVYDNCDSQGADVFGIMLPAGWDRPAEGRAY